MYFAEARFITDPRKNPHGRVRHNIRRALILFPSAKPDRNFAFIHRPDIRSHRDAAMRNTLSLSP